MAAATLVTANAKAMMDGNCCNCGYGNCNFAGPPLVAAIVPAAVGADRDERISFALALVADGGGAAAAEVDSYAPPLGSHWRTAAATMAVMDCCRRCPCCSQQLRLSLLAPLLRPAVEMFFDLYCERCFDCCLSCLC